MSGKRTQSDWLLFALLSSLWASAYALTREAVATLPTALIVPGRLGLGAIILILVCFLRGETWPKLSDRKAWLTLAAMGLIGTVLPFTLITEAQKTVDSSLAALYVSAAPIFVGISSHFLFAEERMTRSKALGVFVGFIGVLVLFGPDAIANFGSATVIAQFLLLFATLMYASSTLIARAAPEMSPLVFSAGFLSFGALFSLPLLADVEFAALQPSTASIISVVALAVGPSAVASLLYPIIVRRAGPTFLSLTGYVIPIISSIIGFVLFREVLGWNAYLAFALILTGVYISQRKPAKAKPLQAE